MKSKQNVAMRFVFVQEEYKRVVAVYSLLISIDKRIGKNKKSPKKIASKKQKKDISIYICDHPGSRKKRASVIFKKTITNPEITYYHDRYNYTYHSSCFLLYQQA